MDGDGGRGEYLGEGLEVGGFDVGMVGGEDAELEVGVGGCEAGGLCCWVYPCAGILRNRSRGGVVGLVARWLQAYWRASAVHAVGGAGVYYAGW